MISFGIMRPYAATMDRSQLKSANTVLNSGVRSVVGWIYVTPCASAQTFAGGGVSF